ncbi:MAG: VTT domain-containing protein [Geminicoccaceae bacterium]
MADPTDRPPSRPPPPAGPLRLVLGGLVIAMAVAGLVVVLVRPGVLPGVADIEAWLEAWGAWAAVLSVLLMLAHAVLPFPAELLAIANGMAFGFAGGLALTWSSAMLSAGLSYALARAWGWPLMRRLLSPATQARLEAWVGRAGTGTLLAARLVPLVPFNLVNYGAGLTGVPPLGFAWTTAVGILPATVLSTLAGSHMLEPGPLLPLALAALAALAFAAPLLRRR